MLKKLQDKSTWKDLYFEMELEFNMQQVLIKSREKSNLNIKQEKAENVFYFEKKDIDSLIWSIQQRAKLNSLPKYDWPLDSWALLMLQCLICLVFDAHDLRCKCQSITNFVAFGNILSHYSIH